MHGETLLIVEDNVVLREGLQNMLTAEGFSVVAAGNGLEALEKLERVMPALILSDIGMPYMDGIEFYHTVRSRAEWVTIPFLFLTAKADPKDILQGKNLGAEDYLTKPISRDELVTTIKSRLSRTRAVQVGQLKHAYLESLTALANAVDRREMSARGHVERVTAYSLAIARALGWKEWQLDWLRYGAILHDIGKIHIPERIIFKTDPLTEEEWALIRRHSTVGAEMVRDVPFLTEAIAIIRHHHENWDGSGYTDGLAGEAIPEGARIVAIADSFDSMTIPRPFKSARSPQEACSEIVSLSGQKYDPKIVATFERIWSLGEIQTIINKR
jgi:putative two-component system response regulator